MSDYDIAHHSIQCNLDKIGARVFEFPSVLVGHKFTTVRVLAHTEDQALEMIQEYKNRRFPGYEKRLAWQDSTPTQRAPEPESDPQLHIFKPEQ